ncbi:hypothetical protein CfE428DRAFT_6486 [Chthoniobacter flavus Ellin428]|uniref:Uncharacterized protein n=1 Tax=Chthoniobacter flavus Ellin428 TaxID=497964 RepID=B4DC45_9BACT|nr:hypothetical protein CfE428DRAFT_6486 [Chthoniobacter flavus Ellin428]
MEANDVKDSKMVGKKRFDHGVLVLREIYDLPEKMHGVQREWYRNGRPKSEEPYKHAVMHGVFKKLAPRYFEWEDGGVAGWKRIREPRFPEPLL